MSTSLSFTHGQLAALARHRAADDPHLLAARTRLRAEVPLRALEKALAKAAPLTVEARQQIHTLLADLPSDPA
ncbi:hypothetical protein [Mycobacterium sp. GA-1285]|uniref:hypothetical protein n=1 Tax=Mycobacterium sp. GA-1285 TaxID=1772282 RepID=UPI000A7A953E|nr:hypothetical protein [Mycobacterium sp. GA-1285]